MIEAENAITFNETEYVIRQVNETTAGSKAIKKVEAVERFFITLIDSEQPRIHNGSMTFMNALAFVFENTPYSFNVIGTFTAERFENFGRENALALFNTVLERYGAEYEVVGNTVTLRKERGARTDFAFRYGVNVKVLDKQIDTHSIATAIRGYGGEPDENGKYPVEEIYVSPHANKYGELRFADPVVDERITTVAGMRARLQRVLIDEPQISVTIDFADLRAAGYTADVPNEGDWGYIIYEPMDDFKAEARIAEINEEFDTNGRAIKTTVTLSNIRRKLNDVMTRFSRTAKTVDRLMSGQAKVPFAALDDAVRNATQALQSAQTELKFENGIVAVDKTNANNLVVLNSAGLGISNNGGERFGYAITGQGIVGDLITVGAIRTANVQITGPSANFYWDADELRAVSPSNASRYLRITPGNLEISGGAISIYRPDGYASVMNGILNYAFVVSTMEPSFMEPGVGIYEYWWRGGASRYGQELTCNAYSFKHEGRYLKLTISHIMGDTSPTGSGSFHVRGFGPGTGINGTAIFSNRVEDENAYTTMTIDLGVPDGEVKTFYLKLRSVTANTNAYIRKIRMWQEG